MKYITFCVPSYNSAEYLHYALDSLLPAGDEIEVLIIDDGSTDKTLSIAKSYERSYPGIFKAIHQENKGHGGAINTALSLAKGRYFKVLDSDDWVEPNALLNLLRYIKHVGEEGPDIIVMDYTYWCQHEYPFLTMSYAPFFKESYRKVGFDSLKKFKIEDYCTLHSSVFKLDVLKKSGIVLPEHCSYEDNLFIYAGLCHSETLCHLPFSMYQYQIGRSGQSMESKTLLRKYRDIIRVGKLTFDYMDITKFKKANKHKYRLLHHHLFFAVMIASAFPSAVGKRHAKKDLRDFKKHILSSNKKLAKTFLHHWIIGTNYAPMGIGTVAARIGVRVSQKLVDYSGRHQQKRQASFRKKQTVKY